MTTANEPVAWMDKDSGVVCKKVYGTIYNNLIPLYTHPAKTLTDEEILKMAADKFHYSEYRLVIEFARAILREAQSE